MKLNNKMEQKVKMKRGEEDEKIWKDRLKKGVEVGEEDGGARRREMSVEEGEVSMEEGGRREGGRERVQRKRRQKKQ